ncbi:TrmH family RNA methyltransferase [Mycoplasma sp. P36-A1]|uniref:TrmH family RNA methyltransferase n=1 Tax=Mycoplasma sp. P36-A1 TaxID=3252900 RepID=UPI003C2B01B1
MITSTTNSTIKQIRKLKQKKYRDQNKQFLIESMHLIQEAIKHKSLELVITTDENYNLSTEYIVVSSNVFEALSNQQSSSGYIGLCTYLNNEIDYNSDIIAIDRIQDPGNCGTILRNALAFNYKNIIMNLNSVDIYNPKTIQASQGAIFGLNIISEDLLDNIDKYKANNYKLIGTSIENAKTLNKNTTINEKTMIFLGNEGQGMSKELLNKMDTNFFIPIDNIDSLNVASASAIMFYQLSQKN